MQTILILSIIIAGIVPVIYTVRVLSLVPLTGLEKITGYNIRYYKGGPWRRRSSWSNAANGEPGATIPGKRTDVWIMKGHHLCNLSYHPFKHLFWTLLFRRKPQRKIHDLNVEVDGTFVMNAGNLVIHGSLFVGGTAVVSGSAVLTFMGSGTWTRTWVNDTGKDVEFLVDNGTLIRKS